MASPPRWDCWSSSSFREEQLGGSWNRTVEWAPRWWICNGGRACAFEFGGSEDGLDVGGVLEQYEVSCRMFNDARTSSTARCSCTVSSRILCFHLSRVPQVSVCGEQSGRRKSLFFCLSIGQYAGGGGGAGETNSISSSRIVWRLRFTTHSSFIFLHRTHVCSPSSKSHRIFCFLHAAHARTLREMVGILVIRPEASVNNDAMGLWALGAGGGASGGRGPGEVDLRFLG